MDSFTFSGRRGVLYFGQFKPMLPCELDDDLLLVPSGWHMLPHGVGSTRVSRSHFVGPNQWSEQQLWDCFRDWVVFDSFVMQTSGASYFDDNLFRVQEVAYSVDDGSPGDDNDKYKAVDYTDVTRFLVQEFKRPDALSALSYAELYAKYCNLSSTDKALLEWFVSHPPTRKRVDAFFGQYWQLLHLNILIEEIIDLPPRCACKPPQCEICGIIPPQHAAQSRGVWLREQLRRRVVEETLVEQYACLIEAAKSIRDRMSHGPHFDRSTCPELRVHGETLTYDAERAASEFEMDSNALLALVVALREVVHALLVDHVFSVKHYRPLCPLKVTLVTHSGRVA